MNVSVVIPTFDRAKRVTRAIESVLEQTVAVREIVVVDDGSTDGTARRVEARFREVRTPEIRVVRQANRGVSAARNRGIDQARGDWIALLDSDDEWLPAKMERQATALSERPGHRWAHCDEIWLRRGRRVNPGRRHRKRGGDIFERCLPLCVVSPSAAVLERALLLEHGGFDETLPACEDYDLWLRLAAREPVLFVDEPLVVKRGGRDDQLSRRVPALDRFRIRALEKALADPALTEARRSAVRAELDRKIEIYGAGARKRGRHAEAEKLEARRSALASENRPPGTRPSETLR